MNKLPITVNMDKEEYDIVYDLLWYIDETIDKAIDSLLKEGEKDYVDAEKLQQNIAQLQQKRNRMTAFCQQILIDYSTKLYEIVRKDLP
mgnify:FL=1